MSCDAAEPHSAGTNLSGKKQSGQAIVLGLVLLAACVMLLLSLFNQGQLVRHRVALENAADATAYTQAKLAARNLNFIAYTNRAMVANEVSIGQINALMSWGKHYRDINKFTKYYLYQTPIAPPSPVTFANVLDVVTIPYVIAGTGAYEGASKVALFWPTVVSNFNLVLGAFQGFFALSSAFAQYEAHSEILDGNQIDSGGGGDPKIYFPYMSLFFMAQNALLTYSGESFDIDGIDDTVEAIKAQQEEGGEVDATTQLGVNAYDLVRDYYPGENMVSLNSPRAPDRSAEDSVEAYQYYAAIVNRNRDAFTEDRHWRLWAEIPDIFPEITLNFGIVAMTIDLDLQVGFGLRNDGGSSYVANGGLENDGDIADLGWAAIDVTSFGFEFTVGLFVKIKFCLPIIGCKSKVILDFSRTFPIGFPLAGATHQLFSELNDAKKILTDWDQIGTEDGDWGGDPDDDVNDGAFDAFHLQTLYFGQTVLPPIYGGNTNVTASYGNPPGFLSLAESRRASRKSYEYTVALAIKLEDIETSDNEGTFNIGNSDSTSSEDWVEGNKAAIDYTRFDLDTCARAEEGSVEGIYQQFVWGAKRPMTTISSAEAYFANPMQRYDDGSYEPANLFSPFWDARLMEPTVVPVAIATGMMPYDELFGEDVPDDAIGVTKWLLNKMADKFIDDQVDFAKSQVDDPYRTLVSGPLDQVGDKVKNVSGSVIDELGDGLTDFAGSVSRDNCAG
ncbi:MAG TPA: hypothetical protein DCP57_08710 [Gammaproteobacteria bacterium]|nr:MAG: hypothetical protein EVA67_09015 [OM182 bacterium]HAL42511.1 hypothetical protein [Gammaproteobacteria bacterium]HBK19671.1 hypothetical protein [Gammaproteobacteria bacterium]